MNALFTKDRSKVTATVHVPYMNSAACWGKGVKRKKKREKTQQTRHGSKLSLSHGKHSRVSSITKLEVVLNRL